MKKIAFTALTAFGLASAAGSLWGPDADDFPSLQVKVPTADACWTENPTHEEGNPCYETTGGWLFGYVDKGGVVTARINEEYKNFGEGVTISDNSDGSSLIDRDGLRVKFTTIAAASSSAPSIAGIGFNYNKPEGAENITSFGGYCITYTLSGKDLQFELGWDEMKSAGGRYDTWYATLKPGENKVVDIKWENPPKTTGQTSGDFKKDNYAEGAMAQPITTAIQQAWSVKIRLKNGTASPTSADFVLHQLGKPTECTAQDNYDPSLTHIIAGNAINSMRFSIADRMLSMVSSKAHSVQVINLYGAVVQAQTLNPGAKMDLSKLPAGIYMVRVPDVGYVSKIALK